MFIKSRNIKFMIHFFNLNLNVIFLFQRLKPEDLKNDQLIKLRYVKFQNVQNITVNFSFLFFQNEPNIFINY